MICCKIPESKFKRNYLKPISLFLLLTLFPFLSQGQVMKRYEQVSEGVLIVMTNGTLKICPVAENAVRVKFYKEKERIFPELVLINKIPKPEFQTIDSPTALEVRLKHITIILNKSTGTLSFADHSGKIFLNEISNSRKFIPDTVLGEPCYLVEQSFDSPNNEYIFGLGQFQDGHFNLRGVTRRLIQVNSQIALPFIYSDRGYGLLWHQYGLTDFNPADNFIHLEKQEIKNDNNPMTEATTTSGTQKVWQGQALYTGKFSVPVDGEYSIFLNLGSMGNRHYVEIDETPVIDQANIWLPPSVGTLVKLKAGEHSVKVICKSDNNPELSWKLKDHYTTFRSPHAQAIDYIVIYGPCADRVIATYRNLSGNAPLLPKWAYGFWQCRERYTSAQHLVETVKEFRNRQFPLDVIVQDWQYWGNKGWGVPEFDETNYPNPSEFIKQIHDLNAHFCISIWSNPDKNSTLGQKLTEKNLYIPNTHWLDYFNPATQKEYWNILNQNMFTHGVDAWWMDAVEPENDALHGKITYAGPGDFYRLTYPLMVSQAVYEGQRSARPDKRVCILTRSAFLGQQRYAIINWSGDVGGHWDAYKRQIVAGLNYTMTGLPYWTTDIGGFFRAGNAQYTDEKYHELLIRWFQWGAFNPIFRVHGYQSETEPWKYGEKTEECIRKIVNLRYRLMPSIYSEAWQVTAKGSTLMRPLVMDFLDDSLAKCQPYEFMFGKSILVAPITEPAITHTKIYLPKSTLWYDFWSGEKYAGGESIDIDITLDKIPLFVKAGSILPMGKLVQSTNELQYDTLEVRVYSGANGKFELYEDDGTSYNYEKGYYSIIPFEWNEQSQTLTVGQRQGKYKSSLEKQILYIVWVSESNGTGLERNNANVTLKYTGKKIVIKRRM